MVDSAKITVTNHRLRKAMSNANDDDLKAHSKELGDKIKSELTLHLGEILKIYPYRDKCTVKVMGSSKTETCLIAHDILSEGMNVSGFPKGTVTHEKSEEVIIPSETIYGIILDVDVGNKKKKCVVSYINLDRKHTPNNASRGEYKIQVGKNVISLTDKYININSDNLFINGLPYTEAYKPLVDYHDKKEIDGIVTGIDDNIKGVNDDLQTQINDIVDVIYPVGSIYMSMNSTNPSILFGGEWERIEDRFLLASGSKYEIGSTGGSADSTLVSHNHATSTSGELFVTSESDDANNTRVTYSSSGNRYVDGMTTSSTPFHHRVGTDYSGSSGVGKNMPPYIAVYMWERVG